MRGQYDLVVIGAGSGGLTAAIFAARLGARVSLVERGRVGGDCTWTGCVPSKALRRAARAAHEVHSSGTYGVSASAPSVDMAQVRQFIQGAVEQVYRRESPAELTGEGIELIQGPGRFLDPHTLLVDGQKVPGRHFIIATGAKPAIPHIPGLEQVPFLTHQTIFENELLWDRLIVLGAGPTGAELAQAYQRLGAQVTLVDLQLLAEEEPEVRTLMQRVLEREGIRFVSGLAERVRREEEELVVEVAGTEIRGEALLVATGRVPDLEALDLPAAGVEHSADGIAVDDSLRTTARHIYAVGDCLGGPQFTHLAAWQGFVAARNALLPGRSLRGTQSLVPRTTFTDPEVARVGLTEEEARARHGNRVHVDRFELGRVDRAVCENDRSGFIKLVHGRLGRLLGATVVADRAGEVITEVTLAMDNGLRLHRLASTIHAYPTYSMGVLELAAHASSRRLLSGLSGRVIRGVSRLVR
ncbi:MAG: dihydrolipoyl dehydrogenase family protein [Acidimicrobiia bacterium]